MLDRREFLQLCTSLAVSAVLPSLRSSEKKQPTCDRLGELLPTRVLGRTGQVVTMLGVGGWHLGDMSEREAQMTIEVALEGGVRVFDTANAYHAGGSERRLVQLLVPRYRDDVYIMTKSAVLDAAAAREHLENSLRRLRTEYLDLWQIHVVESSGDADNRINNGVLEVFVKAKEEGKARHIGFTGHTRPAAHQRMLEKTDALDTCQMPVNLADPLYESFIEGVLPTLVERKNGVLAMKTLSGGRFVGRTHSGAPGKNPPLVHARLPLWARRSAPR